MLTLQSEVAGAIAKAIEVRLSPAESERLATARTVNPRAFEEYLLGRALWNERTEQSLRTALTHFENAARIAPDFALAHAGVADSYIILGVHGYEPPRTVMPKAKAAALTAIALDSTAGEPHASLGDILFHYDWDWDASERELEEGIRLAPAFATAYQWGSETQVLRGDLNGALARLSKAMTIDPLSMIIRVPFAIRSACSAAAKAVKELRAAIELDQPSTNVVSWHCSFSRSAARTKRWLKLGSSPRLRRTICRPWPCWGSVSGARVRRARQKRC